MKALIFNSGMGSRMGELTAGRHKAMAPLPNGETIFARQLRLLAAAGITDVVVTTGPHADQLRETAARPEFSDLTLTWVPNEEYARTNYIYSMHLAAEHLEDDLLMLHGDLVFDAGLLARVLADPRPNVGLVNEDLPLPEKDFKARISGGLIREVSVTSFDAGCVAFQPLYRLSREMVGQWLARVAEFVARGNTGVYAENALNELLDGIDLHPLSYAGHFIDEVDTPEDLAAVAQQIRLQDFAQQPVFAMEGGYLLLGAILTELRARRPLVVGGSAFGDSVIRQALEDEGIEYVLFSEYSPNPTSEEVEAGLVRFEESGCDSIISVGGGSAIDVAKGIKARAAFALPGFATPGAALTRALPHLAIPTTAGTGSESTHFAVVYIDGEKHSIAHDALLPEAVILEPELLRGLPEYHKKSAVLDALVQCIESTWAKDATPASQSLALRGIRMILDNLFPYFHKSNGFDAGATREMQIAANLSGKAINLTKTTAAHAMSYGLTSEFGLAHGHAAALTLRGVWRRYNSIVRRKGEGSEELAAALRRINRAFGTRSTVQAFRKFDLILEVLDLPDPIGTDTLVKGVNLERLGNSPVPLTAEELRSAYELSLGLRPRSPADRVSELKRPGGGRETVQMRRINARDVPELHAWQLGTLRQFDEFCAEHGLQYYLSEGSMLGAVRHGGMIPWDDDIDVMVPRQDFDRLVELAKAGRLPADLNLDSFATNRTHWVFGAKLQTTQTTRFIQPQVSHIASHYGPHIDIFVVDDVRDIEGWRWKLQKHMLRLMRRALFMSSGRSRAIRRNIPIRLPIYLATRIVPTSLWHRWIAYMQSGFNAGPDSPYAANLCSYYKLDKEVFPRDWFGEGRRVEFDGLTVTIPNEAEQMLRKIYGKNWAGIPTLGTDHRKHHFWVRTLDDGGQG